MRCPAPDLGDEPLWGFSQLKKAGPELGLDIGVQGDILFQGRSPSWAWPTWSAREGLPRAELGLLWRFDGAAEREEAGEGPGLGHSQPQMWVEGFRSEPVTVPCGLGPDGSRPLPEFESLGSRTEHLHRRRRTALNLEFWVFLPPFKVL